MRDFCEFFAAIERDPTAIINDLTVRDYLLARQHLATCEKCYDSSVRVMTRYKNEKAEFKDYLSEN